MALSDFLANGQIPEGSAATSMTKSTALPSWYSNAAMQLLANQNAINATPYATYQGPRVAGFTAPQQQSFGMTQDAATAFQPALQQATGETQQALAAPGALQTAQPYMTNAGQSTVANIGAYMNPYTEQVVNRIGELAGRNLSENIMPGIEGRYIAAGQLGYGGRDGAAGTPSGMMSDTARAIRDTQEGALAQQAAALQAGYSEAAGLSAADIARQATLAQLSGTFAGNDVSQQLTGAQQLAGLGGLAQQYGLTGANAVGAVGAQQQGLNQQNLDVAYQDFLKQQADQQARVNAGLGTLQGIAGAVPSMTTEEGISPSGNPASYAPSTAATVGGALTGLAGVLGSAKSGTFLGNLLGVAP